MSPRPVVTGIATATTIATLIAGCASSNSTSTARAPLPGAATVPLTEDEAPLFVPGSIEPAAATTSAPASTTTAPQSTTTSTSTTTSSTTTTTTSTLPPATPAPTFDLAADSIVLGTSIEGRPIVADRFGPVGGRRVLVIGVIHGNEDGGVPIIEQLRSRAEAGDLPTDVEWWLVDSMNPDGQTAQDRHNANQVDLNRNFPLRWGPIGAPGDGQYAGTGPASEPETQAMVAFISRLRPDMTIWYHQDANLIIPSSGRDGRVRARYAELSGLPVADCCDGGIYTG